MQEVSINWWINSEAFQWTLTLLIATLSTHPFLIESCLQPTFATLVVWLLLIHFTFYTTSHQTTLSQIDWHPAFVGRTAYHDHSNIISASLVIISTFCGAILLGTIFPLVTLAPFFIYSALPNLATYHRDMAPERRPERLKTSNNVEYRKVNISRADDEVTGEEETTMNVVEYDITKGELNLFENEALFIGAIFKSACQLMALQGLRVSLNLLWIFFFFFYFSCLFLSPFSSPFLCVVNTHLIPRTKNHIPMGRWNIYRLWENFVVEENHRKWKYKSPVYGVNNLKISINILQHIHRRIHNQNFSINFIFNVWFWDLFLNHFSSYSKLSSISALLHYIFSAMGDKQKMSERESLWWDFSCILPPLSQTYSKIVWKDFLGCLFFCFSSFIFLMWPSLMRRIYLNFERGSYAIFMRNIPNKNYTFMYRQNGCYLFWVISRGSICWLGNRSEDHVEFSHSIHKLGHFYLCSKW